MYQTYMHNHHTHTNVYTMCIYKYIYIHINWYWYWLNTKVFKSHQKIYKKTFCWSWSRWPVLSIKLGTEESVLKAVEKPPVSGGVPRCLLQKFRSQLQVENDIPQKCRDFLWTNLNCLQLYTFSDAPEVEPAPQKPWPTQGPHRIYCSWCQEIPTVANRPP